MRAPFVSLGCATTRGLPFRVKIIRWRRTLRQPLFRSPTCRSTRPMSGSRSYRRLSDARAHDTMFNAGSTRPRQRLAIRNNTWNRRASSGGHKTFLTQSITTSEMDVCRFVLTPRPRVMQICRPTSETLKHPNEPKRGPNLSVR